MALAFTVAMYGSILLHNGDLENEYYQKSREGISPFTEDFPGYFWDRAKESSPGLSAKAFLATEQRFPGIGNGTLQDILFAAGIHPKRKMGTMSQEELGRLLECTKDILREMTAQGGRDTEKDLFGSPGGYQMCIRDRLETIRKDIIQEVIYGDSTPEEGAKEMVESYTELLETLKNK